MIKQVVDLGFMSVLGSPMLLKMIPKRAVGNAIKKVADHYLKSGNFLQEAMLHSSEEMFTAIRMGLHSGLLTKAVASKSRKEFVSNFQTTYLTPFLEENPEIEEVTFRKECSKHCKVLLGKLPLLLEEVVPTEQDVQHFFSENFIAKSPQMQEDGLCKLKAKLRTIETLPPQFIDLLLFKSLLFEGLHYFFQQQIASEPEVKAIFDELNQMEFLKELRSVNEKSDEMGQDIQEILTLLRSGKMEPSHSLHSASMAWNDFHFHFSKFEQNVGMGLQEIQHDIRRQSRQLRNELQADIREESEKTRDMIARVLAELQEIKQGGMLEQKHPETKQEVQRVRSMMDHVGFSKTEIEQLTQSTPRLGQLETNSSKSPFATIEILGNEGKELRRFVLFLSDKISLGRNSQNDLVLYWYPLPEPSSSDNPEWQNWKGTGECHPTLNVSSFHADLFWNGRELVWIDKSSKGSFFSDERMTPQIPYPLQNGSVVDVAKAVKLSCSLLKNNHLEKEENIGWKLKRLNNAPALEEFLFLKNGASLTVGASREDHLILALPGILPSHFELAREGTTLFVRPLETGVFINGVELEEETKIETGTRLVIGDQICWIFPFQESNKRYH